MLQKSKQGRWKIIVRSTISKKEYFVYKDKKEVPISSLSMQDLIFVAFANPRYNIGEICSSAQLINGSYPKLYQVICCEYSMGDKKFDPKTDFDKNARTFRKAIKNRTRRRKVLKIIKQLQGLETLKNANDMAKRFDKPFLLFLKKLAISEKNPTPPPSSYRMSPFSLEKLGKQKTSADKSEKRETKAAQSEKKQNPQNLQKPQNSQQSQNLQNAQQQTKQNPEKDRSK